MIMISEKVQVTERRGRNSNGLCRGGGARSSDEAPVMGVEQRGAIIQFLLMKQLVTQEDFMKRNKPFEIPKQVFIEAFGRVKANGGSAGIDGQSITDFESDLKENLYKLWNRMSSGTYFPPPVKLVMIPKKSGGERGLGIPTVTDRVAQMVGKLYLEKEVEHIFHSDSYGYRPGKSALNAVGKARERCWKYDYVIEFDIKGLFDNINHELLMRAVTFHVREKWLILYIQRWLKSPFENADGDTITRESGTPQGGVISPVLANLFMHYAFDKWMDREFPSCPFERYADDAVIHCHTEKQAEALLERLDNRLKECQLQLHPEKTKIVYCKDKDRTREYENTEFDFLGYTFKRVYIIDRIGRLQWNFLASASKKAGKHFREKIKSLNLHKRSGAKIDMIAEDINPMVRGWLNYFRKYNPSNSAVRLTMECINQRILKWAMCKFKRFRGRYSRTKRWLKEVSQRQPRLFAHWAMGYLP